jgi:hypothetical protein
MRRDEMVLRCDIGVPRLFCDTVPGLFWDTCFSTVPRLFRDTVPQLFRDVFPALAWT